MIENIAIKLADGTLYSLMDNSFRGSMKTIITTEVDDQREVRVEFFKGRGVDIANPVRLEVIFLENIPSAKQGEIDLELVLSIHKNGVLEVELSEPISGAKVGKSIALDNPDTPFDIAELETTDHSASIEEVEDTKGMSEPVDSDFVASIDPQVSYDGADTSKKKKEKKAKRRILMGLIIILTAVLIVGMLLTAYVVFDILQVPPPPPLFS